MHPRGQKGPKTRPGGPLGSQTQPGGPSGRGQEVLKAHQCSQEVLQAHQRGQELLGSLGYLLFGCEAHPVLFCIGHICVTGEIELDLTTLVVFILYPPCFWFHQPHQPRSSPNFDTRTKTTGSQRGIFRIPCSCTVW